jgi:hypothetical protein
MASFLIWKAFRTESLLSFKEMMTKGTLKEKAIFTSASEGKGIV